MDRNRRAPGFAQNPIGVEFDTDELVTRKKEGKMGDFLKLEIHQPVSQFAAHMAGQHGVRARGDAV